VAGLGRAMVVQSSLPGESGGCTRDGVRPGWPGVWGRGLRPGEAEPSAVSAPARRPAGEVRPAAAVTGALASAQPAAAQDAFLDDPLLP